MLGRKVFVSVLRHSLVYYIRQIFPKIGRLKNIVKIPSINYQGHPMEGSELDGHMDFSP
jgi:hypothetical protein